MIGWEGRSIGKGCGTATYRTTDMMVMTVEYKARVDISNL
jgi:hypothetical protein